MVISPRALRDSLAGDWVAFDEQGKVVELPIPQDIGPAALLVSDLTDAVKRVDGERVVESLDRRGMWRVEAIVLNRVILDRLEDDPTSVEGLLAAVRSAGYAWQISPISSP